MRFDRTPRVVGDFQHPTKQKIIVEMHQGIDFVSERVTDSIGIIILLSIVIQPSKDIVVA